MSLMSRRLYYLCITVLVSLAYIETATGNSTETVDIVTVTATTWITTEVDPTTTKTAATPTAAPTTAVLTTALPDLNAPENVTVEEISSDNTAFTVSWDHDPDPRLQSVTYDIIVDATDGTETETVSDVTSVATITNKTSGQEYNITVVAVDENSRNKRSDAVPFRLQPNSVPGLAGESATTDSVTVTWGEPDGILSSYNIICPEGPAQPPTIDYKSTPLKSTCSTSTAGSSVRVQVTTVSGTKSNTAEKFVRAQPNKVVGLKEASATTDSVTVTWGEPAGSLSYYIITCEEGQAQPSNVTRGETPLQSTCTTTTPGSLVNVTVTTVSGIESNSDEIGVIAQPNSVDNLSEADATTNSVTASWEKPLGEVKQYTVKCSQGNVDNPIISEDGSQEYSATCNGVSSGSDTTITVVTDSGGTVLGEERQIPITAYPLPPTLNEGMSTNSSITVYWTNPTGEVDLYLIECQNGTAPVDTVQAVNGNMTASCEDLPTYGAEYSITVLSQSGQKKSTKETQPIYALPADVELRQTPSLVDTVSAEWGDPGGVIEQFNVTCGPELKVAPISDPIPYMSGTPSYEAQCNVMIPGDEYTMTVFSTSGNQQSASSTVELRALPEPVETFRVDEYSNNYVNLSWTLTEKCEDDGCVWTSFNLSYNSQVIDDFAKADRSRSVDNLTPGEEYNFFIGVISFDESSTLEQRTQRLRPDNVGELRVSTNYSDKIVIEWDEPNGSFTSYDTTITGPDSFSDAQNVDIEEVTYSNLTPGAAYTVTICTRSFEEICIQESSGSFRTITILPSKPTEVSLDSTSISSVKLTFGEPDEPNGDILHYIVTYTGTKTGDQNEDTDTIEMGATEFSRMFTGLWPGFTYLFRVLAVNKAGEGDSAEASTTLGEEEPEVPVIPPTKGSAGEPGVHSFKIEFNPDIFSHCNGELLTYTVLVVEDSAYNASADKATSGKVSPKTLSYAQAQNGAEYQAFEERKYPHKADYSQCGNTASRKKRQTDEPTIVPIGDETCSGDYCNGKLHGNRNYRVKFRAFNAVGYADSAYSEPIETKLNHVSWVIPFLFVVIILVAFGLVYLRRKERNKPGSVPLFKMFKFKDGGATNDGFVPDKPMRRTGDTRPIKLAAFGNHLEDMSRDSDYLFSEEYNDLRPVGKNQSTDAAQLEVNRVKNRFSNILPYDHTRVKLDEIDDEEGSDYINANYMLGYISNREYIACQGPLQSTEEDMWRLVWEQGASLIVMVTQLMENGKIKCHQYWPDEGEGPVRYGEIVVNPSGVEHEELWTKRNFQITKGPATRNVAHFNFLAWPDHGVPEKPDDLIRFVQAVRTCKKLDGKPAVVHCSAGVGRTGTFISLDNLVTAMKDKDEVDIFGMVRNMRMNRCLMVQTESQYIFIHQCVMALLEGGPSSSDSEAVYENVNGNGGYYQEALI